MKLETSEEQVARGVAAIEREWPASVSEPYPNMPAVTLRPGEKPVELDDLVRTVLAAAEPPAPPLPAEVEEMRKTLDYWGGLAGLCGMNQLTVVLRSAASLLSRWPGVWRPMETSMKTFTMYRRNVPTDTHDENQRNAPDQPQFEGVVFSDGSVAIRWLTAKRSTAIWASMDDMLAIHGHPEYGSELVWSPLPEPPHE